MTTIFPVGMILALLFTLMSQSIPRHPSSLFHHIQSIPISTQATIISYLQQSPCLSSCSPTIHSKQSDLSKIQFDDATLNLFRNLHLPQGYLSNSLEREIRSSRCGPCLPLLFPSRQLSLQFCRDTVFFHRFSIRWSFA